MSIKKEDGENISDVKKEKNIVNREEQEVGFTKPEAKKMAKAETKIGLEEFRVVYILNDSIFLSRYDSDTKKTIGKTIPKRNTNLKVGDIVEA